MARPLEQAVCAIVGTFQQYAGRCGDKHKLCRAELKELLQKELPTWAPTELRECDYEKFMSVLDTDKDCEVDFMEYMRSLACLCTELPACVMESPLEKALEVMVSVFHQYAAREGDRFKLNKSEMKELLTKELPSFLGRKDEGMFQKVMDNLDSNHDNELDFQEYSILLATVAILANESFQGHPDLQPRGK